MISPDEIKTLIRDVPDFPVPGILFRDMTPVFKDRYAFRQVVALMSEVAARMKPDLIVGIESRGFILGAPVALDLGTGFVPVRKPGKLPAETIRAEYELEYGTNTVEVHRDAITPGQRVLIVDDLLATGGTAAAAVTLARELGAEVVGLLFLVELSVLDGRAKLPGLQVESMVQY